MNGLNKNEKMAAGYTDLAIIIIITKPEDAKTDSP